MSTKVSCNICGERWLIWIMPTDKIKDAAGYFCPNCDGHGTGCIDWRHEFGNCTYPLDVKPRRWGYG